MDHSRRYSHSGPESGKPGILERMLGVEKTEEGTNPSIMPAAVELSADFVARARSGDRECQERLLTRLRPILHTYFIKRIGLKPEVDDLIQNTLLRIHNGLSDLEYPDRFMGFAMKAALFELHDLYRGRYSGRELLYDPSSPPDYSTSSTSAENVDAERALSVLSPRARQILELREYGYRYKEIADMVDTSEAAVKMQVKRAFERMRRLLVA
jgi:RNA polymerase sigma-70 factor (ECF subfamily)